MSGNNVQITSKGIKNSLKKYTSLKSICEYVWNGFDAKATQVVVEVSENILKIKYSPRHGSVSGEHLHC